MTSSPEEIEADIEAQRQQLADTLDHLGRRLDVKARAKERLDGVPLVPVAVAGVLLVVAVVWWRRSR